MSNILQTTSGSASGNPLALHTPSFTVQATVTTTSGNGSCTVIPSVSDDGVGWIDLPTITVAAGASPQTGGYPCFAGWKQVKARTTAISGTGAIVNVTVNGA